MKQGIHPNYKETTITCACGEVIHTRSTKENIRVEVISADQLRSRSHYGCVFASKFT